MNRTMLKRVFFQAMAWPALLVLCGAAALAQSAPPAAAPAAASAARSDGEIEMDVVHALDASKALKSDLITAATIQGEVTLSGTVSTESSSELAEAIAESRGRRNQGEQQSDRGQSAGRGPAAGAGGGR